MPADQHRLSQQLVDADAGAAHTGTDEHAVAAVLAQPEFERLVRIAVLVQRLAVPVVELVIQLVKLVGFLVIKQLGVQRSYRSVLVVRLAEQQ